MFSRGKGPDRSTALSHGTSGAIRQFAGWFARGSVGYPLFDDGKPQGHPDVEDYRRSLGENASAVETLFAIFANNLVLDDNGVPTNAKFAERRAAAEYFRYQTGQWPEGEPELGDGEGELY